MVTTNGGHDQPLLAMPRPPMWVFLDPELDVARPEIRAAIATLEARGAHLAVGMPHDIGVWVPGLEQVSERNEEPVCLSPSWPRTAPEA